MNFIRNKNWPIAHGFFDYSGGLSSKEYAVLNAEWENNTQKNIQKIDHISLKNLGIFSGGWLAHQKHTARAIKISQNSKKTSAPADALISCDLNCTLGVLTADCAPVLFYDDSAQVVAAAHAGWRGALSGILENTVQKMYSLGAHFATLQATIGPTIAWQSYAVSYDFIEKVQKATSWNITPMVHFNQNKCFFDLPLYVRTRLQPFVSNIFDTGIDTFGNSFFSHRYASYKENEYKLQLKSKKNSIDFTLAQVHDNPQKNNTADLHGRNLSWVSLLKRKESNII